MEVFNQSLRGTAKVLASKEIGTLIVKMIYPAVLTYCYEHLGEEEATKTLFNLGASIMDDFLKIYAQERDNFKQYIKDYLLIFFNSKAKIKKIEKNRYHIIDDKCILCQDIALEGLNFHYCVPYAGSIQRLLQVLAKRGRIPNHQYEVKTISSRGNGDKHCIHEIKIWEV